MNIDQEKLVHGADGLIKVLIDNITRWRELLSRGHAPTVEQEMFDMLTLPEEKADDEPVDTQLTLPVPFEGIYAEANVREKLWLLELAKDYHIRQQNFEEALKYRELAKRLEAEAESAAKTIGADYLKVAKGT